MTCDRCKEYHQRLFVCYNDAKSHGGCNKYDPKKKELICGKCIIQIWGWHTHKIVAETTD